MSEPTNLDHGVPYIEFSQPGASFFACVIDADQLIHRFEIRRRSEHSEDGVQRDDNPKRISEIASYASQRDAIFPTPIILSASSDDFEFNGNLIATKIKNSKDSLGHVLDGQHRLLGLQHSSIEVLEKIQLLVVFAFDIDRYSEATIFATINGNQKQVTKSLMYDLFSLHPGRSVEKTCHEIVKSLNEDSTSPFYGRIKILGRKANEGETLSQAAFIDHAIRLFNKNSSPLRTQYNNQEDWVIRKVIANIFTALDQSLSTHILDVEIPENYFYKTTGFGGVVKALVDLAQLGATEKNLSVDWFKGITDIFIGKFVPPKGVGNSAMLEIRDQLLLAAKERA